MQQTPPLKFKSLFFYLGLACCNCVFAFSGEGYGTSQAEARKEALSSLASSIFVQIESESNVYKNTQGENFFESSINTRSDLPLIGPVFDCMKAGRAEFFCRASLDKNKAVPAYQSIIKQKVNDANMQYAALAKLDQKQQYQSLNDLLGQLQQLDRYYTVVFYLERDVELAQTTFSRAEVLKQLHQLTDTLKSLDLAVDMLTDGIKQKNIFVSPPAYPNTHEVTPFASALQGKLASRLNTSNNRNHADYFFQGRYQLNGKQLQIDYSLSNNQGNVLLSKSVVLDEKAYQGLETKPQLVSFDQLLHKGYALPSELNVELASNKGSRQLLFKQGETVELLVRLNKPAYFYVVGHTRSGNTERSYLLDLFDEGGDYRFIQYVNADQVNRWISLGEFDVSAPYGVESLQVLASSKDPVSELPAYRGSDDGYFEISNKLEKALQMTRGLKRKKNKDAEKQEAVLMFTTVAK